jgi:uncharacterized protein with ATP-grasp and redox domains
MRGGITGFLLDPDTCFECLFWGRWRLGINAEEIRRIAKEARGRTEAFVETYRRTYRNGVDPFADVRARLNSSMALHARELLWLTSSSPLKALSYAAAANSVDVWVPGRELAARVDLEGEVRACCGEEIEELIESADLIVYLLDNSGEAVIDMLVAHALTSRGAKVVLVARSEPYEVDITEGEAAKLLEMLKRTLKLRGVVEVAGTGSAYPAPAADKVRTEVVELLAAADVVVSKGIANLEALMEYCSVEPWKTVVALRAKCSPIARLLGIERGQAYVGLGYRCLRAT